MKIILSAAAALALLAGPVAAPVAAQTMPIVIYLSQPDRDANRAAPSVQDRVAIMAEAACARPFIRNLPARALYLECLAEARTQAEALLTEATPDQLAMR
jgi:hypothetical protein